MCLGGGGFIVLRTLVYVLFVTITVVGFGVLGLEFGVDQAVFRHVVQYNEALI